jgi:hypothetical protein
MTHGHISAREFLERSASVSLPNKFDKVCRTECTACWKLEMAKTSISKGKKITQSYQSDRFYDAISKNKYQRYDSNQEARGEQ